MSERENETTKKKRIRIVTYNIHAFGDQHFEFNALRVTELLYSLKADVICLNEATNWASWKAHKKSDENAGKGDTGLDFAECCQKDCLSAMSELLGMEYQYGEVDGYGNAVFSRFPFECYNHELFSGNKGRSRFVMKTKIDLGEEIEGQSMFLFFTHLDHISEKLRVSQAKKLIAAAEAFMEGREGPYLFCGDFNALKRTDYTDFRWEKYQQRRDANGWEGIETQVTEMLDEQFTDAWYHVREKKGLGLPQEAEKEKIVATSCHAGDKFGPRIDYFWLGDSFLDSFDVLQCDRVIQYEKLIGQKSPPSDHHPVILDFWVKEEE
eukprot:TRINITY_DN7589_c0_g1_i1.p1 TRINITY_DN7589_c0_g1~~TRINITY_DN7589_c0_g1_i1.p1  ORF type:complete len:323 (-),score=83.74 TRINITY_DN7589_c0_g1_i1:3-971(-)